MTLPNKTDFIQNQSKYCNTQIPRVHNLINSYYIRLNNKFIDFYNTVPTKANLLFHSGPRYANKTAINQFLINEKERNRFVCINFVILTHNKVH